MVTGTADAAAHAVSPDDERRHPEGPEDLWGESYYADFVHEDGTWGGWLRLGLYPNRDVAWWTTWIVGADRPGVCSINYQAPVPAGDGLVAEEAGSRIELELVRPLREFRIAAAVPAELFDRPQDVYAGKKGRAARLELDLTWTTDGTPYHYDLTTRYEIPCTVAGNVAVDGATMTVAGQGQRDHSWGVRDWWAFGWCWSSCRLDDGTRVHAVDIRPPGFPMAFGYVQRPPATVDPVTTLTVTDHMGDHGFPTSARLQVGTEAASGVASDRDHLDLTVTPVAFGPALFTNDDGRISRFPRALIRVATADGRVGSGWIEWNQPQVP
jgi:hypothetical protein